ncbi:type II toxin-antitoxin system HicA family toxin [Nocardioides marmoriginsengisoli]|uniref:Type II toxin-antitoxin system HicA family toxin n=1 Tax=Nocardioides marmoriginsengisoli TaxID=661483 RepID=A0A3N0CJK0_9ACTN|nr:type II toxin-antitoxin system HicA family toxin [Nocardioides marmoriginsengisoli]RNL63637.1 type II toxin-antitoxin system HicA family toxin [Nocardioides marmoriginsengisoli]
MVKAITYREITKALRAYGCTPKQGKGDHEKWYCPCGKHMTPITQTREVSPGLVRQAIVRLECLPKGWLK